MHGLSAPHSEKAVLGSLIFDGMQAMEQCLRLQPEMFYLASHATLFRTMQKLSGEGRDWNLTSLLETLQDAKHTVGLELADLSDLMSGVHRNMRMAEHVERICNAWKRRKGAELCERHGLALRDGEDAEAVLSTLQQDVSDVIAEAAEQDDPLVVHHSWTAYQALEERAKPDTISGLSYGCDSLDGHTGGMRAGEVTVVGARSGVGKSSLMCQSLAATCRAGFAADCFSLEMDREELLHRLWAAESGVPYYKIDDPRLLNASEKRSVQEAAVRVAEWKLRIYEKATMPIDEIVARARMSVRRHESKLIAVDYAQLVHGEGKDDRTRVAAVSMKLRAMAKDEGVHVMLLSQLRKVSHEQYNTPPTAADLRETGQIENDAHLIVLLHRGWDDTAGALRNDAEILLPKFRRGKTGTLKSQFTGKDLRFA